jgi:hypothetical protein
MEIRGSRKDEIKASHYLIKADKFSLCVTSKYSSNDITLHELTLVAQQKKAKKSRDA